MNHRIDPGTGHHLVDLGLCHTSRLEVEQQGLIDPADGRTMVTLDVLLIAEDDRNRLVDDVVIHQKHILELVSEGTLRSSPEVDRATEELVCLIAKHALHVDRALGLPADVVRDVVHIEMLLLLQEIADIGLQGTVRTDEVGTGALVGVRTAEDEFDLLEACILLRLRGHVVQEAEPLAEPLDLHEQYAGVLRHTDLRLYSCEAGSLCGGAEIHHDDDVAPFVCVNVDGVYVCTVLFIVELDMHRLFGLLLTADLKLQNIRVRMLHIGVEIIAHAAGDILDLCIIGHRRGHIRCPGYHRISFDRITRHLHICVVHPEPVIGR